MVKSFSHRSGNLKLSHLKALTSIIYSNIFIALAAVSLTIATQVQLGMQPEIHIYLAVIFFATLLDYNLHRYIVVNNNPETRQVEKYKWSAEHLPILKILLVTSIAGLINTMCLVETAILLFLSLLAILTILYSIPGSFYKGIDHQLMKITGIKTLMIAFVWTAVTVFLPIIH